VVRTFLPHVEKVVIAEGELALERIDGTDLCEWRGRAEQVPERYRLIWRDNEHRDHIAVDPYCYPPQLSDFDLHLFCEGKHRHAYRFLGAQEHEAEGVAGVLIAVWAPSAQCVRVIVDFNRWDGRCHPMRVRGGGIWELFIPDMAPGALYKLEIRGANGGDIHVKSDPYGRRFELRPASASIVGPADDYIWSDGDWLEARAKRDWQHTPMSIYEVHLGSWQRGPEGEMLNYREMAHRLVDYASDMGFSHIELLPITEPPRTTSRGAIRLPVTMPRPAVSAARMISATSSSTATATVSA
jgi:1,4-alpha-glucan branching enzyme